MENRQQKIFTQALIIAIVLIASIVGLWLDTPPDASQEEGVFSATRAKVHLDKICDRPHGIGTQALAEKRDYIIEAFRDLGYQPRLFIGKYKNSWGSNNHILCKTENILVVKKGSIGDKQVFISGHYDSVSDSPGAADDGHSIASMLEVATLIKDKTFKNDIVFYISDGEEEGLFGAQAYSENFNLDSIGVVLNFEARGNAGPSYGFEWSNNNYWLVEAFAEATTKPIANSLSYEVYNRMPNGTDLTKYLDKGVPGINHAFIDGFSYYHSPLDNIDNLDMGSFQHSGDYMYTQALHFGNYDFSVQPEGNATFFNALGFLIYYPSGLDLLWIALSMLALIFITYRGLKEKVLNIPDTLKVFMTLILGLGLAVVSCLGMQAIISAVYPHYFEFYAGQFYNHEVYAFTYLGISMMSLALTMVLLNKKVHPYNFSYACSMLFLILSIALEFTMPSASYVFYIPLFLFSISACANIFIPEKLKLIPSVLAAFITYSMWSVLLATLYLAFSHSGAPFYAILSYIFCLVSLLFFPKLWTSRDHLPGYVAIIIALGSIIYGHLTSSPTEEHKLPSTLETYHDLETDKTFYTTDLHRLNEGNAYLFQDMKIDSLHLPWQYDVYVSEAEIKHPWKYASLNQSIDSTTEYIELTIHTRDAIETDLLIEDISGMHSISMNHETLTIDKEKDFFRMKWIGYPRDSILISIKSDSALNAVLHSKYDTIDEDSSLLPITYMREGNRHLVTEKVVLGIQSE